MHTYRDAFPSLYRLLASALTFGASSLLSLLVLDLLQASFVNIAVKF